MNPGQELQEKGYTLDAALHHNELIPFVVDHLFRKNTVTIAFLICNIIFFMAWLVIGVFYMWNDDLSLGAFLKWSAFGAFTILLFILPHELLHGLAYRMSGATNVSYKANWRKMYFMAIADGFITGRKAFYFIGLTPFIFISLVAIVAAIVAAPEYRILWLTVLWLHATMCAGDFGLMSYFRENRQRDVVTFDDTEKELSYFYSRNAQT
jgi:hypothetical protein